jgi:hypothetical protein
MRRKFGVLAIALAACVMLAACDKCGDLQQINYPGGPKACDSDKVR